MQIGSPTPARPLLHAPTVGGRGDDQMTATVDVGFLGSPLCRPVLAAVVDLDPQLLVEGLDADEDEAPQGTP
ncbi:hypothetical protein Shyhy01_44720 [Streptomyces hygroscopicus subsp. hygroscopicus]|nr:hypothetical protein Shyhy01_44720 [Streptomyces hygroscopicus subsp. hygroscopicus]